MRMTDEIGYFKHNIPLTEKCPNQKLLFFKKRLTSCKKD